MVGAGGGRARFRSQAWGAALGIAADRLFGEPPVPDHLHPVAVFGRAASLLERRIYGRSSTRGTVYTGVAAGTAAAVGAGLTRLGHLPASTLASYLSVSGKALHTAAQHVEPMLAAGDLDGARERLTHLVGRDPTGLDRDEVARAVVESVAENTTDAVVAPALWAAAAGAPGAFLHRAADTLDSMVGYRNDTYELFGAPSARTDDALAWLPARVTAGLVGLVRPHRALAVGHAVRRDAAAHPSPNAGVAEAAFAAALGLRLGGTNRYGDRTEERARLGDGRPPGPTDIGAAVTLSRDVSWALAGMLMAVGTAGRLTV
jgi:adenosylcobinamide-phosphate synthase